MHPIARRRVPTGRSMAMFSLASAGLLRPPNIRGQYDPRNVRNQPHQRSLLMTLLKGPEKRREKNAQAAQPPGFQRGAYPRVMLDPRTGRPVMLPTMPMQRVARGTYPPGYEIVIGPDGRPWGRPAPAMRPAYSRRGPQAKKRSNINAEINKLQDLVFGSQTRQ